MRRGRGQTLSSGGAHLQLRVVGHGRRHLKLEAGGDLRPGSVGGLAEHAGRLRREGERDGRRGVGVGGVVHGESVWSQPQRGSAAGAGVTASGEECDT